MKFLLIFVLLVSCASKSPHKQDSSVDQISSTTHITRAAEIRIEDVTRKGNFFKISQGTENGITMGQQFKVQDEADEVIAEAEVVAIRPQSAFLRVNRLHGEKVKLAKGLIVKAIN